MTEATPKKGGGVRFSGDKEDAGTGKATGSQAKSPTNTRASNGKEIFDAIEQLGSASSLDVNRGTSSSSSGSSKTAGASGSAGPNRGACGCLRRSKSQVDPPFQQTLVILR